jgi:hypothetical protein
MTRIITTHHRYKPPPKKRKTIALAGLAIITPLRRPANDDVPAGLLNSAKAPEPKPDDPKADAAMREAGPIIIAYKPKRGRQRKPAPAIPNRIVTYTPKRKRDAWAKYLRLTGLEEPPMTASLR